MTDQPSESAFGAATRIVAADDGTNYDNVAVTLHWLTVLLVLIPFALALTWDDFSKPIQQTMQGLHISFGILLAVVVMVRIAWRWVPGHQVPALEVGWVRIASKGVHYLLYLLLVAQAVTGFLFRWAQGHALSFFGLLAIPSPFAALGRAARHDLHGLHEKIGWSIVILAFAHALAALYHHYVLKDRVLMRMLPADER